MDNRKLKLMKIGRNAPCPCGSGKKYKKCCLRKHEEEALNAGPMLKSDEGKENSDENINRTNRFEPADEPEENVNIEEDSASDAFYKDFFKKYEEAEFSGKVSIIKESFSNPELISDSETVFELFNELGEAASNIEERKIYLNLVLELRKNHLEIYEKEAAFILDVCVSHALIDNQINDLEFLFKELSRFADDQIDIFSNRLDHVAYYGHLDLILDTMRISWGKVRDSSEIVPWGIDEFADRAGDYEMFHYLSNAKDPTPDDDVLIDKMKKFSELDLKQLEPYFQCIAGTCDHTWQIDDFEYKAANQHKKGMKNKGISEKIFINNIWCLANEFMGYLNREMAMPYPKAEVIRSEIVSYLDKRVRGDLQERSSPLELAMNPKKKRNKAVLKFEHILCPDKRTFERFLIQKFDFMNSQLYRAIAFFESIPKWLQFLELKDLIGKDLHEKTLKSISRLNPSMEKIIVKFSPDELILLDNLRNAWNYKNVSAGA